jgi:hypothetical protein
MVETNKMTTISDLRDQLEIYDRKRRAVLDDLAGLSDDQLKRKPGPKDWSIMQVVQHMVLAERDVLQNLPEPVELIDRKRGLRARLSYALVLFILRWGIRVPVPAEGMVPDGNTSLSEVRQRWDENLRWLNGYIDTLRPEDLKRAVFSHPIAGPLTGPQAGKMAKLHFEAHLRQIRKIRAQVQRISK